MIKTCLSPQDQSVSRIEQLNSEEKRLVFGYSVIPKQKRPAAI
jgi:hypothetical protein